MALQKASDNTRRIFIGFRLHPEIQSSLRQTVQKLKDDGIANGTLTTREKLHVTIKFIGNTPGDVIPMLLQELQKTVADKGSVLFYV